jgi:polar amino acid transport system substrate-binding protein
MKKVLFTSLFILMMLASVCHAGDNVTVAVDQSNPPFMYKKGGKAMGLYPTIVEVVFKEMGVPVDIKAMPWKRALQEADAGKSGIAGIYKNSERLKKYDYSQEIFQEKIVLFVLKEKTFSFASMEDLKGKKVGTIFGWSYGDQFDTARKKGLFAAEDANGDDINFKKLVKGRIDCLLAIEESGKAYADKEYRGKIVGLSPPVAVNPTYLIFGKTANNKDLLSQFDKTVISMNESGKLATLIETFFANQ